MASPLPVDAGAPERNSAASRTCCSLTWEEAYLRFETPRQEIAKFQQRLRSLGADRWPRETQIVELFCGRGNGLKALEQLGFTRLEGIDLSASLLAQYQGPARTLVGDCRQLPLPDNSRDLLLVQGGLHHLERLPDDLAQTLSEVRRVLRPGGKLVAVEPWDTPFLRTVHFFCRRKLARRAWGKLDALATMIDHEAQTYFHWLSQGAEIRRQFASRLELDLWRTGWGKLMVVGRKPEQHLPQG